jgi:hypothetical protein
MITNLWIESICYLKLCQVCYHNSSHQNLMYDNTHVAVMQKDINQKGILTFAVQDIAILSVPTFQSPNVNLFQSIARSFINMSVSAGKSKLIFDFRGNSGGNTILGYDTFKQIFPQTWQEPFGATQMRTHDILNLAGKAVAAFNNNTALLQTNPSYYEEILALTSVFNFQRILDIHNQNFTSWSSLFGPYAVVNSTSTSVIDAFTARLRYNFSDPISDTYPGFNLTGLCDDTNTNAPPFQPFKTEDILMLHDGTCSSTCAIASELLKSQGGIRSVVIGGLPQGRPMQAIGGTKGAQSFRFDDIQTRLQVLYNISAPDLKAQMDARGFTKTAFAEQVFKRAAYPDGRPAAGINLKNNMRRQASGVEDADIPLEFIYEAADCRLWYTPDMINDVRMVWKGVADAVWRSGGANGIECVDKTTSTQGTNGTSGAKGVQSLASGRRCRYSSFIVTLTAFATLYSFLVS